MENDIVTLEVRIETVAHGPTEISQVFNFGFDCEIVRPFCISIYEHHHGSHYDAIADFFSNDLEKACRMALTFESVWKLTNKI